MINRLFLVALIAMTSCSSGQSNVNDIRGAIHGIWVREDYINSLKTTKSPSKSSEFLIAEVSLNIKSIGRTQDTMDIGVSFNNHEGGSYRVSLQSFKDNKAWIYAPEQVKSNREIEFAISNCDTLIFITKYSKTGKVLTKVKYIKVLSNPTIANGDMGFGVDYITNKILFEGTYSIFDANNALLATHVTLDPFGKIKGWPFVSSYEVLTDFTVYEEDDVDDVIVFWEDKTVKAKHGLIFKIDNNSVLIEENLNGKKLLVYKLTKEN
jgi:hypothetical protein